MKKSRRFSKKKLDRLREDIKKCEYILRSLEKKEIAGNR